MGFLVEGLLESLRCTGSPSRQNRAARLLIVLSRGAVFVGHLANGVSCGYYLEECWSRLPLHKEVIVIWERLHASGVQSRLAIPGIEITWKARLEELSDGRQDSFVEST